MKVYITGKSGAPSGALQSVSLTPFYLEAINLLVKASSQRRRVWAPATLFNLVLNIINVVIGVSPKGTETASKIRPATLDHTKFSMQSFRTSTPRVIGVQLDLE